MFQLNIQNFRSFKNIDFDFSRINILIGPNNSGKSTLLKFFLMLKQSINEPESTLTVKGKLVDLGQFEDVIYKGSKKKEFGFTFGTKENYWNIWKNLKLVELEESLFELSKIPVKINIRIIKSKNDKISSKHNISHPKIGMLEIKNERKIVEGIKINHICDIVLVTEEGTFAMSDVQIIKPAFISGINFLSPMFDSDKKTQYKKEIFILEEMVTAEFYLTTLILRFNYINPLNALPKRIFEKNGKSNDLEVIVNWLSAENNEELRNERVEKLSKLFRKMGIADEVKLNIYGNHIIEVFIKTEKDGFWINLADVGLGISLLIPTLLQAFAGEESENGNVLLLEQPEIHIHPKLHENFIETLVGMGKKNTYFIETHSPFIVQKLQVMVKEGQLKPEDVAIYYFEKEGNETTATRYNIEEDGFMDKKLPQNFIGNSYNLAMQLLK